MGEKEVRKITVGLILSWVFGVLFLLFGMGVIAEGAFVNGILIVLFSALIIPYSNRIFAKNFHFEISGGIKFVLFILIIILAGFSMHSLEEAYIPTAVVVQEEGTVEQQEQPEPKVKSATLSIDRVTETVANLGNIRITITNTGDVSIEPQFDVVVTDSDGKVVCEDSPMFGIGLISSGEKKTDEISILGCMFEEDGDYTVKVDLLDKNFNKLDTDSKTLTVNYWGKFS